MNLQIRNKEYHLAVIMEDLDMYSYQFGEKGPQNCEKVHHMDDCSMNIRSAPLYADSVNNMP
jgi:hypothetical protein